MKATELKFNNLVKYNINDTFIDRKPHYGENIYIVKCIFDDRIKIDIGFDALQPVLLDDPKLEPIPLTEDWLVKFGFEKIQHIHEGTIYIRSGLKFHQDMTALWRGAYIGKQNYFHQLQNLYHALTGQELCTNPQT